MFFNDSKPIFIQREYTLSEAEKFDILNNIIFDRMIDLCGNRYDLYTHRMITTSIMLISEYDHEKSNILDIICDDNKIKTIIKMLYEFAKLSHRIDFKSENYEQAIFHTNWHETTRSITDHLSEDEQPSNVLKKLIKLYTKYKEISGVINHNIFSDDSTLFIEDLKEDKKYEQL